MENRNMSWKIHMYPGKEVPEGVKGGSEVQQFPISSGSSWGRDS